MSVNISLIVLKKMYDILMILDDFCGQFPWFWLIFCYPDPDQFHLSGSGSGWPKWNGSKRIRIRKTGKQCPVHIMDGILIRGEVSTADIIESKICTKMSSKNLKTVEFKLCGSRKLGYILANIIIIFTVFLYCNLGSYLLPATCYNAMQCFTLVISD